jgi:hypothetical protein
MHDLILGGSHQDPPLKFETDGSGSFLFVGYSPVEISELLATLREHQSLMFDLAERAQRAQTSSDAVRYTPSDS